MTTETADRSNDLNRMCLPHHLEGMTQAEICNTARWAQGEIERLRCLVHREKGRVAYNKKRRSWAGWNGWPA